MDWSTPCSLLERDRYRRVISEFRAALTLSLPVTAASQRPRRRHLSPSSPTRLTADRRRVPDVDVAPVTTGPPTRTVHNDDQHPCRSEAERRPDLLHRHRPTILVTRSSQSSRITNLLKSNLNFYGVAWAVKGDGC